jgi:homoserine dehydrogenase
MATRSNPRAVGAPADTVVLKFGSSVLRTPADLPWAVQEIYAHRRRGARVVAVVSAFAGVTDALYARAREHGTGACATAALVATGEFESASLLTLALDRCGVPARLLEPRAVTLRTHGTVLDAEPVEVDRAPLERALGECGVVVFPGFCGVGEHGETTLLGRGGSDLTALFLAERLGARCVLVKDVDGLYERDPALPGPRPARYDRITWEDALRVGGKVVQPKTLRSARLHGQALEIRAIGRPHSTVVGPEPAALARADDARPRRVALLGLGVVGGGVYERLASRPDLFDVVRIVVRDPARHAARGVPPELLSTNPWEALAGRPDVIVEALGGVEPAAELMLAALLDNGCVVTANKAALAAHYDAFAPFLASGRLRCSAAVGGAVPVLEAIGRLRGRMPVTRVRGVLNGTCNFVLDRLAAGADLETATAEAQSAGYAEPDPSFDLAGHDAAHKLELVVRAATGATAGAFPVAGLDAHTADAQREALARHERLKLVATWDRERGARVAVESLAADDALAGASAEENRVEIGLADGTVERLAGRGAGRAPTTTAVVADLLDVLGAIADGSTATTAAADERSASA